MEGKWDLELQEQDKDKEKGWWDADMAYTRIIPLEISMNRDFTGTKFSPTLVPGIAPLVMERTWEVCTLSAGCMLEWGE